MTAGLLAAALGWAQEPAKPPAAPAVKEQPKKEEPKSEAKPVEENLTGSVEVGYRFVGSIPGSLSTYRTFVNLGEGPRLLHLDFRYLGALRDLPCAKRERRNPHCRLGSTQAHNSG